MTKLMEWLLALSLFTGVWAALITRQVASDLLDEWMPVILPLPILLLISFAIYATTVVLWRVYTFNNCEDAAKELHKQIQEAKDDLQKKGLTFES